VEATLGQGLGTPDLGGQLNTCQLTDLIIQNMKAI
jgi:isocitrate/isopropylmalate dehydrogenase